MLKTAQVVVLALGINTLKFRRKRVYISPLPLPKKLTYLVHVCLNIPQNPPAWLKQKCSEIYNLKGCPDYSSATGMGTKTRHETRRSGQLYRRRSLPPRPPPHIPLQLSRVTKQRWAGLVKYRNVSEEFNEQSLSISSQQY